MKYSALNYLVRITLVLSFSGVTAQLASDDFTDYDKYCPNSDSRAIHAEPLGGHLLGWEYLVCFDELSNSPKSYFITLEDEVVEAKESNLPIAKRLMYDYSLIEHFHSIPTNKREPVKIEFKFIDPGVQSSENEEWYASSSGTGEATVYIVDGNEVSQEDYEIVKERVDTSSERKIFERYNEIRNQAKQSLQLFVELNGLEHRIDVDAINGGTDPRIAWSVSQPQTIKIDFNRTEVERIIETSASLVYISLK